ncbi:MAG TPA: hypothetical protein VE862_07610 [Candidatus Acidoferrum sp.]|nr:hypothetical protein [Candidatus Acidoferrum sp.]
MPRRFIVILPREIIARNRNAIITSSNVVYALILNRTFRIINRPITDNTSKSSKAVIKPMIQTP